MTNPYHDQVIIELRDASPMIGIDHLGDRPRFPVPQEIERPDLARLKARDEECRRLIVLALHAGLIDSEPNWFDRFEPFVDRIHSTLHTDLLVYLGDDFVDPRRHAVAKWVDDIATQLNVELPK